MQEKTKLFLNRVARLQEKKLLTQKELLLSIGLSKGMLSFIRNGKHPPSVKILRRLAQAEIEAGIEAPVTEATTMSEMQEKYVRTGRPMLEFLAPDYLKNEMQRLRTNIKRYQEQIETAKEDIRMDREQLAELSRHAKTSVKA